MAHMQAAMEEELAAMEAHKHATIEPRNAAIEEECAHHEEAMRSSLEAQEELHRKELESRELLRQRLHWQIEELLKAARLQSDRRRAQRKHQPDCASMTPKGTPRP
mmetsp:Transcript_16959/g.47344  ORF Transcript_16959/g.47344 Transcript_16959/m.47344 type:complete len:106 (-) Transcript_16959:40-357(-)